MNRLIGACGVSLLSLGFLVAPAMAQVEIINWGASSSYTSVGGATTNGSIGTQQSGWTLSGTTSATTNTTTGKAYSLSSASTPAANYSAPSSSFSGTFYSAGVITNSNTSNASFASFGNATVSDGTNGTQTSNDSIRYSGVWSAGTGGATTGLSQNLFHTLTYFKKSDFLGSGSSTGTISTDTSSTWSISGHASSGFGGAVVRLIVLEGSQWYISSTLSNGTTTSFSALGSTGFTVSSSSAAANAWTSLNWFAYDPSTSISTIPTTGGSTKTFSDIQAAGVYMRAQSGGTAGTQAFGIYDISFSANVATAIPEPSTYAAAAGLMALVGVVLHRRRKATKTSLS